MVTSGCQEAVFLALKALTSHGDIVAVETPTYHGHLQTINALGLKALEIPTHPRSGISLAALQLALEQWPIKACLVIPNFSNPLGSCMSDKDKSALALLAAKFSTPLIEDDIFGDIAFNQSRPSLLKQFDASGNVIYCSSFSKTMSPGLRVGWVASNRYLTQIEYQKYITNISTPALQQLAIADMLSSGRYEKHLRFIRTEFAKCLNNISETVCRYFPPGTKITKPDGGYVIWIELPKGIDTLEIADIALKQNISIAPGAIFSATQKYQNYLRISCGVVWNHRTENALIKLANIISVAYS